MPLYGPRFHLPTKRAFIHRSGSKATVGNGGWKPELSEIDKALNCIAPDRMTSGEEVTLRIERICGFEIFGAYENWGSGYRITDGEVAIHSRWLDIGLARFAEIKERSPDKFERAERYEWAKIN